MGTRGRSFALLSLASGTELERDMAEAFVLMDDEDGRTLGTAVAEAVLRLSIPG